MLADNVVRGMNKMMRAVVTEGTGGRAGLDGIPAAGKTGSTSSYKDIWFVGYTGNAVGAIWFGNDDTSPMREGTTGGLIAAPTWRQIMEFVHQGVEILPLPGLAPENVAKIEAQPSAAPISGSIAPVRPTGLSKASSEAISAIGSLLEAEGPKSGRYRELPVPSRRNEAAASCVISPSRCGARAQPRHGLRINARPDRYGAARRPPAAGPWSYDPASGSPEADPYQRADIARRSLLPMVLGEGVALTARVDSAGAGLLASPAAIASWDRRPARASSPSPSMARWRTDDECQRTQGLFR